MISFMPSYNLLLSGATVRHYSKAMLLSKPCQQGLEIDLINGRSIVCDIHRGSKVDVTETGPCCCFHEIHDSSESLGVALGEAISNAIVQNCKEAAWWQCRLQDILSEQGFIHSTELQLATNNLLL